MAFSGPLRIQRPFYPEGTPCHLYLLHPPGGLVSGDSLRIEVQAGSGSQSLLTTPSAGKVYRRDSAGVAQGQQVRLQLDENAECEWLPQETIVYRGARAALDLHIELAEDARFIGWELVCLGRPAGEHWFDDGSLTQRLQLWRGGRLLFNERLQLTAGDALHRGRAGLNGGCVFGTLLAAGPGLTDELIAGLRETLPAGFAVTERLGVLLVRYLGNDMNDCRTGMWAAWEQLRPVALGREASFPRIWFT
ncbi:urease accessory protein UreD [Oceanimonas pelagia]|uniref:Urease accessory protein UreD n=1 Tax=Oceanimonas pelagia TaxID=3028314 RepID=A0AA50QBB5_9GAMM|nr:urease accessory protein UreD [Oceanimonas pelagia]WMC11873.1 urease accessory protein UreD [Oceanimonas pelagia]